jgi:hypothetical protein
MAPISYGLIELMFVFGVGLCLGLWELFKIRCEIKRGSEADNSKARSECDRD